MKMVVTPVFQPILDLKSKQFRWLEALARINGDFTQRGHIQLLSLGEECGFIHHIDRAVAEWVLDSRESAGLPISINVSVVTIERNPESILGILRSNPGGAHDLILEITETARISSLSAVHEFCHQVWRLGGRIAVDDFGTGHFTADLVGRIQPDFIKLAQALVSTVVSNRDMGLLKDISVVASAIGAEMIAEGIDTPEKLTMLDSMGCRYAQGFLIAKPMTIPELWSHRYYPPPPPVYPVMMPGVGIAAAA